MKNSIIPWGNIITIIIALAFGFICFLGKYYATLGDVGDSLLWGGLSAVVLGGLAYLAKLFKISSKNISRSVKLEYLSLTLFGLALLFCSIFLFPHFFLVLNNDEEIKTKIEENITQAEGMFAAYESYAHNRLAVYESELESVIKAKYVNPSQYEEYGFVRNISDDTQKENKLFTLRNELFPPNYSNTVQNNGTKDVALNYFATTKANSSKWKPFEIIKTVNNYQVKSKDYLNKLVNLSEIRQPQEEADDFSYVLESTDVSSYFKSPPTPLILNKILYTGLGLVIGALMLLSWFIAKRVGGNIVRTQPYEVVL